MITRVLEFSRQLIEPSILKRFARFFAVGACGVLVNMGVLLFLTESVGLPYVISSLVAIELSIVGNFALNNAWTWSDRRVGTPGKRLLKYHLVAGFSALAGNWCLLILLTSLFALDYRLANLVGIAAGVVLNFVLNHHWTFSVRPSQARGLREWLTQNIKGFPLPKRYGIAVLVLLAAALVLRMVCMEKVPLVPEEAYYWMYSQHPSLSYFDHPPMVAWVIRAGTLLLGNTELGVRAGGAFLMLAASALMYLYGRIWFGRAAGLVAAVLLQSLPIFFGAGIIATMDSALVFFWLVGLVGVSFALREQRAWGWYLAGIGLGGAMLSKYTGVFLGPGAVLAVLAFPPWRRHLRTIHPYLAALLALALFSPVLIWNAQHEWASFRFQFVDRFSGKVFSAGSVARYAALQLIVATPLLLAGLGWLYTRTLRSRRRLLTPRWLIAVSFSLPLLLVMSYKSFRYDIHINWTLPVYLSVFPAIARLGMARWRCARRGTVRFAGPRIAFASVVACLSANLLLLVYVLAIQPRTGWVAALNTWPELAKAVESVEEQLEAETGREPLIIANGKYRLASELAFYRTPLEHASRASDFTTSQWILGGEGLGYPYWAKPWKQSPIIVVADDNNIGSFAPHFRQFTVVRELKLAGKKKYQIAVALDRRD